MESICPSGVVGILNLGTFRLGRLGQWFSSGSKPDEAKSLAHCGAIIYMVCSQRSGDQV